MADFGKVNLQTIAKAVGVSHMTVSRALRGQGRVAEATRQRVLAEAKRLGYRPNPLVQAYGAHIRSRGGQAAPSCNLCWLRSAPQSDSMVHMWPWQKRALDGARERAETLGYSLEIDINAHDLRDAQLDRILEARGVRGVLLPFNSYLDREPYQNERLATVAIGESPGAAPVHTVSPDFAKNLTAAVDHLLQCGYRRIGFCEHAFATVLNQGTQCGAYQFNQLRLPPTDRLTPLVGLTAHSDLEDAGRTAFLRWFEQQRPDAILVTFNQALKWLESTGVQVPSQVALVHLALTPDVKDWSGIATGESQIGAAAVDLLTAHLLRNEYGTPAHPKLLRLTGTWRDGNTAPPLPPGEASPPASKTHPQEWFEANIHDFGG